MLNNGTVLHGRYRIVRLIGSGGMGAVYEAIDWRLDVTVAVKQCRLPGADADSAFEREAKLLAVLRHPSLPVVMDYFVDDGAQFLVMQFVEGDELRMLLDRSGERIPPAEVAGWARTLLDVLSYLHNHVPPVVHRDIKPANVKRTPLGEIVLLDFGLAKGWPAGEVTQTDRSVFGYTLAYAPPEQIQGMKTDPRSDVYAVGATLYHLLTGRPPVNARDRSGAVGSGTPDPLPMAHVAVAAVPESLGRLIGRAMALDAADRYSSARDMREALNACNVDETTRVTRPHYRGQSRRIDAAVPSRAAVGRRIDLLVQVRFEGSPRLGVEDWPSKKRPSQIEQGSEALQLTFPTDSLTGRFLPARLRIKVVAPDFNVENQNDRLIEVPTDEYSKRLAFLLTPLRTGTCRINIEVYGLDDLFLGAVPVEMEAVAATGSEQEVSVGNLVLEVVARQVAALLLGAGVAAASSPPSLEAGDLASAAITMSTSGLAPMRPTSAAHPAASAADASRSVPQDAMEQTHMRRLTRAAVWTAPVAVVVFAAAALFSVRPTVPVTVPAAPAITQPTAVNAPGPAATSATTPVPAPVAATPPATPLAPPPASTLMVPLKAGESVAERNAREKLARYHLDDGKKAMEEKRFTDAIDLLQRAMDTSARPDFGYTAGEAASLLKQARTAKAAADPTPSRERAQKLVDQAKALAGSDIAAAVRRLREALALDPKSQGANELTSSLQNRIVAQGEAALTSARNFDRYARKAEALREFDRAIQLLELVPGGHKDLAFARQRSAELRAPK